ncbi:MAG: hypothetical protein ABJ201_17365, partial [Nisaea sp.]
MLLGGLRRRRRNSATAFQLRLGRGQLPHELHVGWRIACVSDALFTQGNKRIGGLQQKFARRLVRSGFPVPEHIEQILGVMCDKLNAGKAKRSGNTFKGVHGAEQSAHGLPVLEIGRTSGKNIFD